LRELIINGKIHFTEIWHKCGATIQNFFSSSLLPKNIKFKVYKTKILPVFYIGVRLVLSYLGVCDMYGVRNAGET